MAEFVALALVAGLFAVVLLTAWERMRAALPAPVEDSGDFERGFARGVAEERKRAAAPVDREDDGRVEAIIHDWLCGCGKGQACERRDDCREAAEQIVARPVATEGQECPACGGDGRERYGDWGSCHVCQDKNLKSTNKGEAQ